LEDNWALRELAKLLGTKALYGSGKPYGYEDDILLHKDKNPNTRGVKELVPEAKPFSALLDDIASSAVTHVIALGGAAPASDAGFAVETLGDAELVLTIAAHAGILTQGAKLVLPATSWAEHSGTYVNF